MYTCYTGNSGKSNNCHDLRRRFFSSVDTITAECKVYFGCETNI